MKKLSKILFTDLDDTLLNTRKQITAENRRAIQQALQRGHQTLHSWPFRGQDISLGPGLVN